jgi:hypothetical protein
LDCYKEQIKKMNQRRLFMSVGASVINIMGEQDRGTITMGKPRTARRKRRGSGKELDWHSAVLLVGDTKSYFTGGAVATQTSLNIWEVRQPFLVYLSSKEPLLKLSHRYVVHFNNDFSACMAL